MIKTKPIIPLILAPLLATIAPAAAPSPSETVDRPNILLILVDDLNDWIGAMNENANAHTPNMDRLAERGTLFTNAHAAAPLCGPTRAALLSGLRPSTTGIYGHNTLSTLYENEKVKEVPLLPAHFAANGYTTMATGKVFHFGAPASVFDEVGMERRDFGPRPKERIAYTPPPGHHTSTDWGPFPEADHEMPDFEAARWAVEQIGQLHADPFLMIVGFVRPHVPWTVPQKWFDLHPLEEIVRPPWRADDLEDVPETARNLTELKATPQIEWMQHEQRWESSLQGYHASVSFVDHYIGTVLDALAESPHADNTIIVLLGDHGYHLGEKNIWAKHTLWERSTRTPMIVVRPDDVRPSRTHRPVNHIDLYPTLIEMAGLPKISEHEGQSLVPLLDDPFAEGFEASVTTHGYGNHSVRTERWRYTRYEDGSEELYDHLEDANEWRNLASLAAYREVIEQLSQHLPKSNALWVPESGGGMTYNDHLTELFERTRAK